jgi:pimeloyl-ACP methyl ester carboxylesterase
MAIWEENSIEKEGKHVHYYYHSTGHNPPMIFLHGFMDNGLCYDRVAEQFIENHDVFLIDARGHGQSSDVTDNTTYHDLIEDVHDVCIENQLHDIIIGGHSMGGAEAGLFAAEYPDLVKAVILEDPGFSPKSSKTLLSISAFFLSLVMPHQKNPASLEKHEARAKKFNPKWVEHDQLVWGKAEREFRMHYPGKDLKVLSTSGTAKEVLPRIQAPILLITSQHGIISKKKALQFQSWAPNLKWIYIPNAGHSIRREQFDLFIDAIKQFLKDIEG